jgi:hypothetical protein
MKVRRKRTHFVPRAVYRTAFVGVVPICVAGTACGGGSGGMDSGPTLTVACTGFCGAVGAMAFTDAAADVGDAQAEGEAAVADSVADVGDGG